MYNKSHVHGHYSHYEGRANERARGRGFRVWREELMRGLGGGALECGGKS